MNASSFSSYLPASAHPVPSEAALEGFVFHPVHSASSTSTSSSRSPSPASTSRSPLLSSQGLLPLPPSYNRRPTNASTSSSGSSSSSSSSHRSALTSLLHHTAWSPAAVAPIPPRLRSSPLIQCELSPFYRRSHPSDQHLPVPALVVDPEQQEDLDRRCPKLSEDRISAVLFPGNGGGALVSVSAPASPRRPS